MFTVTNCDKNVVIVSLPVPLKKVTADQSYQFPADAELYLEAPLDTSFTCEGLDYGFYADINNNCQARHLK